jgi:valyl-tRNA synthetase
MGVLQSLIVEIRALRKEIGVEEKATTPVEVRIDAGMQSVLKENTVIVERLARVSELRIVDQIAAGVSKHSTVNFDVAVIYERTVDVAAEGERLTKEIAKYEKGLISAERQLGNEGFLAKAPAQVVEGLRKQEAETRLLLEKARAALENLKKGS